MNNRERRSLRAQPAGSAKSPGRARPAPDAQPLNKKRRRRLQSRPPVTTRPMTTERGAAGCDAAQGDAQARLQQDEMDGEAAAADSGTALSRAWPTKCLEST